MKSHGFVEPASWTDEYRKIFESALRESSCTDEAGLCAVRQGR